MLVLTSGAKMEYRVLAVSFDNADGPPSNAVQVVLDDRFLPATPSITGASGAEEKVTLNFAPGLPAEKTVQFLVLRSGCADDLGAVIGDPLPGNTRQFTDLYVAAGESHWYRLVAVDKAGNRNDPTRPVMIRVGTPPIPAPAAPTLQFSIRLMRTWFSSRRHSSGYAPSWNARISRMVIGYGLPGR